MKIPSGLFGPQERMSDQFDSITLLEMRVENDSDGNPIYIGYSVTPNENTALTTWYIIKCIYVSTFLVRKILPNNGIAFVYSWDARATYF